MNGRKLGCGCTIVVLVLAILYNVLFLSTAKWVRGTVEKTVVDRGNTYFVFIEDGGTREILENEDSVLFWKFNSNDFLMEIDEGERYELMVVGWRVPFLSWFKNIVDYQKIE